MRKLKVTIVYTYEIEEEHENRTTEEMTAAANHENFEHNEGYVWIEETHGAEDLVITIEDADA